MGTFIFMLAIALFLSYLNITDIKGMYKRVLWAVLSVSIIVLAVVVVGVLSSKNNAGTKPDESEPNVVAIVTFEGGMCVGEDGSGKVCSSVTKFYSDGRVIDSADLQINTLSEDDIIKLDSLISESDLDSSLVPDENGFCQSYVDGSDVKVEFPGKYGDKSWVLCKHVVKGDEELLNFVVDKAQ